MSGNKSFLAPDIAKGGRCRPGKARPAAAAA